jgi:hypothetical protein
MDKRNIILITIISTVLSVITMLLSYFGIIRYFTLRLNSTESYTKKYKYLPPADEDKRVVVTLTTTEENKNKLKIALNSILDQTVRVDQIALNIPSSEKIELPDQYKEFLNIYRVGKRYGELTNVIGTLLRETEADTYIIIMQDNYTYGIDIIETLLDESNNNPNSAIQSKGVLLVKPEFFTADIIDNENPNYDKDWLKDHLNVEVITLDYLETY